MRVPQPRQLALVGQVLGAERADRLKHPVAPTGRFQEGLLRERGQQVLRIRHPAHGLDRGERRTPGRPSGEHGHPPREIPLLLVEQLPAPLDDRAQRAVPGRLGAVAARQQPEAVAQAVGELVHGERAQPGRGEFDRQRQPVEGLADPVNGLHARVEIGIGPYGGRPVHEQTRRGSGREWRHRAQRLTGDTERLPARGEDAQPGTRAEQHARGAGRFVDEMLAVVEHEQHLAPLQRVDQPLDRIPLRPPEPLTHPERREQRVRHLLPAA